MYLLLCRNKLFLFLFLFLLVPVYVLVPVYLFNLDVKEVHIRRKIIYGPCTVTFQKVNYNTIQYERYL